jgi:hypothetical protein
MEVLEEDFVLDAVSSLKKFMNKIDRFSFSEAEMEESADRELIKSSIAGALIEFEGHRSWRHNPLLYLKVAFIGLDHAVNKPAPCRAERDVRILKRLTEIPLLLQHARMNLKGIPETYLKSARAVMRDGRIYLEELSVLLAGKTHSTGMTALQEVSDACDTFEEFLFEVTPSNDKQSIGTTFLETLRNHYKTRRNLTEISLLAEREMEENLAELVALGEEIAPGKRWLELYNAYLPLDEDGIDSKTLYAREIDKLALFFQKNGFADTELRTSLMLCDTPTYLRSIRSSASFSAALSVGRGEKDLFYITPESAGIGNQEGNRVSQNRLHREHKFLAAHEVVPGHHLLDSMRRRHPNPIRRQIESPLFYEGWASYAETLLSEYGYLDNPLDRLVDYKRRLWRAARCVLDVGLNAGSLTQAEALNLLTGMGFIPSEAAAQVNRIRLYPGYQLCYFLGYYEILNLRTNYANELGLNRFHRQFLEGGELPFHLAEKRLQAHMAGNGHSDSE